jgi:flagellar assembly factor FliW
MPRILTAYFGELDYVDAAVFQFPYGLPGFESERAFVFLQQPQTEPLMFLQSLGDPQLCFLLLPILVADPNYRVNLDAEDLAALHLAPGRQPRIGEDILCAAIVRAGDTEETEPTANLMAPVVVNLKEQIGIQMIQAHSGYSHRQPLTPGKELVPCS